MVLTGCLPSADTASLLFQTSHSGRAELGLTGDDRLHLKVSPDGLSWTEALVVDGATGKVGLGVASPAVALDVGGPLGLKTCLKAALPAATPAGQLIYISDEADGATPAFADGTNWRRVADRAVVS